MLSGNQALASEKTGVAGIAGRYATALFELADEKQLLDPVETDLASLRALLAVSTDFQRFVMSLVLSRENQVKGIAAVSRAVGLSPVTRRFLGVVAANRRLFALPVMITVFLAKLAERRGERRIEVMAAQPLSNDQQTALVAALTAVMGGQARVEVRIDPMLLGGLVVKVGSRMVDSSLRTKLQRLQLAMKRIG